MNVTAPRDALFSPPRSIAMLALVYLFGIALFFLYRVAMVLIFNDRSNHPAIEELAQAFLIGFRFDTVIVLFALLLPAVTLPGLT
ncbi:MAG: hypothetical protein IPH75_03955 [bacterium]|nr:hypothetical protein [bacterium]